MHRTNWALLPMYLERLTWISKVAAGTGQNCNNESSTSSVVRHCAGYEFPEVVCMHRYGTKLPLDFYRQVQKTGDTYYSTNVPGDPSFHLLQNATFLVWDQERGRELLGSDPSYEFMFEIADFGHEAPVYVPDTNELWFSQLSTGVLAQLVVNLTASPPKLSERTTEPPIYAPVGGRYFNGKIYFSAGGGNSTLEGGPYHPGIYTVDPRTGKSAVEINNYYGWYFNLADDLDIDHDGRIWFTDPLGGRNIGINTMAPQIQAATYRYDPATGAVNIVDDTIIFPNGISFSPDGKVLYMTDTDAAVPMIDPSTPWQEAGPLHYNSTNKRTVYAFDVSSDGLHLLNRRPLYTAMDYAADGLKVTSNGLLITGAGHGVDILDPSGTHILRIQTNFTAVNVDFTGPDRDELWIVGNGGVARAKLNLTGTALRRSY